MTIRGMVLRAVFVLLAFCIVAAMALEYASVTEEILEERGQEFQDVGRFFWAARDPLAGIAEHPLTQRKLDALLANPRIRAAAIIDDKGNIVARAQSSASQEQLAHTIRTLPAHDLVGPFTSEAAILVRSPDGTEPAYQLWMHVHFANTPHELTHLSEVLVALLAIAMLGGTLAARWLNARLQQTCSGFLAALTDVARGTAPDKALAASTISEFALLAQSLAAVSSTIEELRRSNASQQSDLDRLANSHGAEIARLEHAHQSALKTQADIASRIASGASAHVTALREVAREVLSVNAAPSIVERRQRILSARCGALDAYSACAHDLQKLSSGESSLADAPFTLRLICERAMNHANLSATPLGAAATLAMDPRSDGNWCGDGERIERLLALVITEMAACGRALRQLRISRNSSSASDRVLVAITMAFLTTEESKPLAPPYLEDPPAGIHLAREVARAMGGTLVRTDEAGASNVVLNLPLSPPNAVSPAVLELPLASAPTELSLKGMRILIAEDNVVNLLVAQSLLNAEGAICETARDGAEAVQRWFTARHDLILMDCQMPGMDGYQATARIRSIEAVERCASVPILAITANAVIGDQEKCLAAGMNAYLAKPYSKDGLMFALKMAIARSPRVAGASKHIDLTRIYELRNAESQGAENLLARVAALFASSTPQLLRQLRECVERGDSSGIQAVAHKLKSSSAQVGAIRLSNTAVRIESTARLSGAGAVLMTDVEEAEVQFDQAASQLREIA